MKMENLQGITIVELKKFLENFQDGIHDEEPFRVWIETDENVSNLCESVWTLNRNEIILKPRIK